MREGSNALSFYTLSRLPIAPWCSGDDTYNKNQIVRLFMKGGLPLMMKPLVGVVMGSDSDLPIMQVALKTLEDFGISFEVRVISAQRVPAACTTFASEAALRGLKVIIAAAGMAAHLPSVVAAHTPLPVIGVPISGKFGSGVDALYSIVQMPPGIPVATVGLDAARNAALLAIQILGTADESVAEKFRVFKLRMAEEVTAKDAKLQQIGYSAYLAEKKGGLKIDRTL